MIYKHDFAWGDTRGIREIMMAHAPFLNLMTFDFGNFGYPPHPGRPELIEAIRGLIKDLTGYNYKYVLVTNGALNGLAAYLYAAKNPNTMGMFTNALYFGRYPGLANNADLIHLTERKYVTAPHDDIWVVDSPSNPEGEVTSKGRLTNCVWDAAYYSPTYCGVGSGDQLKASSLKPVHEAMAGSLNKLTGINGIRIGWLATDNVAIYNKALEYLTSDLCGVSQPSQVMAHKLITTVDMNSFYKQSKRMLDDNKGEIARLSYLFGNQQIPYHGMFVLFDVDASLKRLFEKASVNFMPGSSCGDDGDSIRINLGNSNSSTKAMVDDILKADKK